MTKAGNLQRHATFKAGEEIKYVEYDSDNRLKRKELWAAAACQKVVLYDYSPSGLRTAAGGDTYGYDERGRLTTETKANGDVINYQYDDAGNRTRVETVTSAGTKTVDYTYDAMNRVETVTEVIDGGDDLITQYGYDEVGNLKTVTHPNGTSIVYRYDRLNRLRRVENRRPDTTVFSSYDYTLGPAGNRTRVVETVDGQPERIVDYVYDDLYRLTRETVTVAGATVRIVDYTYDDVGNRLSMRVRDEAGSDTQWTYQYDDRDRLTSVTKEVLAPVAAGPRQPSRHAGRLLVGLGVVTLAAMLMPVFLLRVGRAALGTRTRRRRVRNGAVTVFLALLMLIGPENIYALHVESMLYRALAAGSIGQTGPEETTFGYDDNGNLTGVTRSGETDTYPSPFKVTVGCQTARGWTSRFERAQLT